MTWLKQIVVVAMPHEQKIAQLSPVEQMDAAIHISGLVYERLKILLKPNRILSGNCRNLMGKLTQKKITGQGRPDGGSTW